MLIWILTILSYLSIILAFILIIFKKITNVQNKVAVSNCFLAILFGISLLYSNIIQVRHLQSNAYKNIVLIFAFTIPILILILANIKQAVINKKKGVLNIEQK